MMNGITIQLASLCDMETISRLAYAIWWPTYRDLLPHGQIRLMLEQNYSNAALKRQLESGQRFSLAIRDGEAVGFVGFQPGPTRRIMRIEKLYVLSSEQGKGTGKSLIDHVAQQALASDIHCLELNVYRHNPARAFYEKVGFSIVSEIDIPYHGYVLMDYIMQKPL